MSVRGKIKFTKCWIFWDFKSQNSPQFCIYSTNLSKWFQQKAHKIFNVSITKTIDRRKIVFIRQNWVENWNWGIFWCIKGQEGRVFIFSKTSFGYWKNCLTYLKLDFASHCDLSQPLSHVSQSIQPFSTLNW